MVQGSEVALAHVWEIESVVVLSQIINLDPEPHKWARFRLKEAELGKLTDVKTKDCKFFGFL